MTMEKQAMIDAFASRRTDLATLESRAILDIKDLVVRGERANERQKNRKFQKNLMRILNSLAFKTKFGG